MEIQINILLLTQYYPPEPGSASMRMGELSEYLAQRGHKVTVVTVFPNYPDGKVYEGHRMKIFSREREGGRREKGDGRGNTGEGKGEIEIIRVPLYVTSQRRSFRHRMLNHISFMLTAIYGGLLAKKPNVIYFYSPPLFLGFTAWVLKKFYRVPTVVEINDLWPQAPIALEIIKNKTAIQLAEGFERFVYKRTDYLFFYSHTHRGTIVDKGISGEKTEIHPLWVDTEHFCPLWGDGRGETGERKTAGVRERYSLGDKFVVMYAGVIGLAQGLDVVIEAASRLKDNPSIVFVLIGDGAEKADLVKKVKQEGLSNVLFIPFQPVEEIPKFLSAADVLLAHLAPAPHRLGTIPAKVLAYMSMGRPLLIAAQGETADLVKRSGAGIVVEPGDPEALAKGVLSLYRSENRNALGKAGREYALEHFDKEKLLGELERRLGEIGKR
jgi:colanic acid biosynthesis glycosyl transferase WcaI